VKTGLLYLGLGMSFTGAMLYLIGAAKAPGAALLGTVLLFRLASWSTSAAAGQALGYLSPLRLQQGAGAWRVLAVVALSLVALLPGGLWSLAAVVLLLALCGLSSGVLGVVGMAVATDNVPRQHQSTATFLFNAVSNGAAGLGAWLAGVVAQEAGFAVALAVSGLCVGASLWLWHRH
jgi:hypothetical protein